jgi:hypothetical protein
VMRGNEGDRMPVRFRYSCAKESDSRWHRARRRWPGQWRLGCCPRKGMTPGWAVWAKNGSRAGPTLGEKMK